jgi:capsule biosynthesis phosphatase
MVALNKVVVFDIDGTLCEKKPKHKQYRDLEPNWLILDQLRKFKSDGVYIILYSSRQMRTYQGNIGRINANTAKTLFEWLDRYNVPYDEIHFGKPWCGFDGFYVDDRAVRPNEIVGKTYEQISEFLQLEDKSK